MVSMENQIRLQKSLSRKSEQHDEEHRIVLDLNNPLLFNGFRRVIASPLRSCITDS